MAASSSSSSKPSSPSAGSLLATAFTHTTTTALPRGTTRREVLALLHDHGALIRLNPLVVELRRLDDDADPASAPADGGGGAAASAGIDACADAGALTATATATAATAAAAPPPDVAAGADMPPSPAPTATYSVTDRLALLPFGLCEGRVAYSASFRDTVAGVATTVRAPMGVRSLAEWVVEGGHGGDEEEEGDEEQQLVLKETARVTCSWFVRPLVEGTMRRSHEELCVRFVEELERRKREGGKGV